MCGNKVPRLLRHQGALSGLIGSPEHKTNNSIFSGRAERTESGRGRPPPYDDRTVSKVSAMTSIPNFPLKSGSVGAVAFARVPACERCVSSPRMLLVVLSCRLDFPRPIAGLDFSRGPRGVFFWHRSGCWLAGMVEQVIDLCVFTSRRREAVVSLPLQGSLPTAYFRLIPLRNVTLSVPLYELMPAVLNIRDSLALSNASTSISAQKDR